VCPPAFRADTQVGPYQATTVPVRLRPVRACGCARATTNQETVIQDEVGNDGLSVARDYTRTNPGDPYLKYDSKVRSAMTLPRASWMTRLNPNALLPISQASITTSRPSPVP